VEHLVPTTIAPTVAEGIASAQPTRVREVLRAVRESGGGVVAVDEAEIVEALASLARKGFYVEPTSAAAAAGLGRLLESGAIRPDETTVLVLTGSGLKASARIGELLKLGSRRV
jgi:threonine synthase